MILDSDEVTIASFIRKPARARSRRYSSAVRSFPPVITSITTSNNLPAEWIFPSCSVHSTSKSAPSAGTTLRQLARISTACSSSQSWITFFITYALQPEGTSRKKSQGCIALRACNSPPRKPRCCARSSTCGRSARTPRTLGCFLRMDASRMPLPPPTSMMLPQRPKSYAAATIGPMIADISVMGIIKHARLFGMLLQVFPAIHPEYFCSRRLTRANAVKNFRKRSEEQFTSSENENGTDGTRHARAQELGKFGVCECSRRSLLEHALTGQEAQDTVQSRLVHFEVTRQFRAALRAIFQ